MTKSGGKQFGVLPTCIRLFLKLTLLCTIGQLAEGKLPPFPNCGKRERPAHRIVGGYSAEHGEFPWMVSLYIKNVKFRHECGGAILNDRYIVTAAHCIDYPKEPKRYFIFAGLHRQSKPRGVIAKKYRISKVIVHEHFSWFGTRNDIALLRTTKPIKMKGSSGYINSICLPTNDTDPTGNVLVSGWGDTKEDGDGSDELMAVEVPMVSREKCDEAYGDISKTQICAGKKGKDSCQADSGGPLMQQDTNGIFHLYGIVSYGRGCGREGYPGVYTKVSSYLDWLEQKMVP